MKNNKRKSGLDEQSRIRSERKRREEIEKGMEAFKRSREEADDLLV